MYMSLLQLKVKPQVGESLREFYQSKVINELKKTAGCLFASLIQGSGDRAADWMSMTLWDSREHADAFRQSRIFNQLLSETEPFQSESSEWKIQLSNP